MMGSVLTKIRVLVIAMQVIRLLIIWKLGK